MVFVRFANPCQHLIQRTIDHRKRIQIFANHSLKTPICTPFYSIYFYLVDYENLKTRETGERERERERESLIFYFLFDFKRFCRVVTDKVTAMFTCTDKFIAGIKRFFLHGLKRLNVTLRFLAGEAKSIIGSSALQVLTRCK